MSPEEIVKFAAELRAAGVSHYESAEFSCDLLPPPPTPMEDVAERIREMHPEQRIKMLDQAKRELDEDLYGASG